MQKLTPTQAKALKYIGRQTQKKHRSPTLRELCDFMGYSAVGSAQDIIRALRKKGFLKEPKEQKARDLVWTKRASDLYSKKIAIRPKKHTFSDFDSGEFFNVPCLGAVPAGNPLEAIEEQVDTIRVSTSLFKKQHPKAESLFALKTDGMSMIDAGILDGDWLIASSQNKAEMGSIVIARLGEEEVTCKRLMSDSKKGWYLKPENPSFSPIYASDQPFEIIAKVVALQRFIV